MRSWPRWTGSPVVELNRAVALGMAFGPAAGLALVDALTDEPALRGYHLLPSVRGDLLSRLGRLTEARTEFQRAAALTRNARERTLLLERADACRLNRLRQCWVTGSLLDVRARSDPALCGR
jgi:predicted RNA polymerase sigma factor